MLLCICDRGDVTDDTFSVICDTSAVTCAQLWHGSLNKSMIKDYSQFFGKLILNCQQCAMAANMPIVRGNKEPPSKRLFVKNQQQPANQQVLQFYLPYHCNDIKYIGSAYLIGTLSKEQSVRLNQLNQLPVNQFSTKMALFGAKNAIFVFWYHQHD